MVDKRIYEYPESLANNPEYVFTVDRNNNATGKITYENMGKQLTTDIEKARTWILTKVDDDTFALNSVLGNEQGESFSLVDGQIFKIQPLGDIPAFWQPNANPKIKINSADAIDVYNGIFYDEYGIKALDRNTLWNRGMYFVYDATLDALLVYKEQYNSGDVLYRYNGGNYQSGTYPMNGTTPSATTYPVLSQVLIEEGNGSVMVDMGDTCFCGRDSQYTPHGVITEGSIKADMNLTIDFSGYFYAKIWEYSTSVGILSQTNFYNAEISTIDNVNNPVNSLEYQFTLTFTLPNEINLSIPHGTNTLTKRRGMYIERVL